MILTRRVTARRLRGRGRVNFVSSCKRKTPELHKKKSKLFQSVQTKPHYRRPMFSATPEGEVGIKICGKGTRKKFDLSEKRVNYQENGREFLPR
jgi:hypothetical protein